MYKKAARLTLMGFALVSLLGCNIALDQGEPQPVSQAPFETIAYLYAQETLAAGNAAEMPAATSTEEPTAEPKQLPAQPDEGLSGAEQTAAAAETATPSATLTHTATFTTAPTNTSQPAYIPPAATFTFTPTVTQTASPTPTFTSTVAPSATAANTQSSSSVACNNGNSTFLVAYMATPPSLDGNIRYWTSFKYGVPHLIYGDRAWAGEFDLSATMQTGWNAQYLFLAVYVQDERYVQNVEDGYHLYDGDSVEVVFDADLCGDFNDGTVNTDDYQIGFNPGYININGDKYAYRWFPRPVGRMSEVIVSASRGPGDVTIYEVGIPWSSLGVTSPAAGQAYGFALSVSDNDDNTQNVQESVISTSYRYVNNPHTWATIVLQ